MDVVHRVAGKVKVDYVIDMARNVQAPAREVYYYFSLKRAELAAVCLVVIKALNIQCPLCRKADMWGTACWILRSTSSTAGAHTLLLQWHLPVQQALPGATAGCAGLAY